MQASKYALVSVSEKKGLTPLAQALVNGGYTLIATPSTGTFLRSHGIESVKLEELTGFESILGGRVKTLHPKIFGGILARTDSDADMRDLERVGGFSIDTVVCNLYPFADALAKKATHDEMVENIDIGGVSLLRAAAKNHRYVSVLCDPDDYENFIAVLKENNLTALSNLRRQLAKRAFQETSLYDSLISHWFCSTGKDEFPETLCVPLRKKQLLRYGENPHQKGALYTTALPHAPHLCDVSLAASEQGKLLSYNNFLDIEHAVRLVHEFKNPTVAIFKHNVPSGVGWSECSVAEAYARAFACDSKSPFGGIVCANRRIDGEAAKAMAEIFLEVIIAPEFSQEALDVFATKKNLRVVTLNPALELANSMNLTHIQGGFLLQQRDSLCWQGDSLRTPTRAQPNAATLDVLANAFRVVKHVRSNAIVLANTVQTVAIAGGFTNRVDAVDACLQRAILPLENSVLASDAFFPFPDSIERLRNTGILHVIQPGGSVQDKAVIDACDALGISMTLTGMRHFKH